MRDEYIKRLLDKALLNGADCAEAFYSGGTSTRISVFGGEVDSFLDSNTQGIGLRALYGRCLGQSYSEMLDDKAIEMMTKMTKQSAEIYDKEEDGILCAEGFQEYDKVDIKRYNGSEIAQKHKIELVLELYNQAFKCSDKVRSVQHCALSMGNGDIRLCSTSGMDARHSDGMCIIYIQPILQDEKNVQTGFAFSASRDFYSIDPVKVASEAVGRALDKFNPTTIKSGEYTTIIGAKAMISLIEAFAPVFSAKRAQEGLSLLASKQGEMIASDCFTLIDDPLLVDGYASCPFDGEGVSASKLNIIDKGRLTTLLYNLESAKKAGVESNGRALRSSYKSPVATSPTNLYVEKGEFSLDQLMNNVQNGVQITELEGLHAGVNNVSGDFSLSAKGFCIENGEKTRAVDQIVVSGNFFEMLKQIIFVGMELEWGTPGSMCVGSAPVVVEGLHVAGE